MKSFDIKDIKDIKYILYNKKNILIKILKLMKKNKSNKIKINNEFFNLIKKCKKSKKSNLLIKYNNSKKFIIKFNEEIKFKIKSKHHAIILIPERNREHQIDKAIDNIKKQFAKCNSTYTIIFIHQNNKYEFNRGKLINIGVLLAKKYNIKFDYIIMHDIDMWAIDYYDYSYTYGIVFFNGDILNYDNKNEIKKYFYKGAINIISLDNYLKINGFSNEFFGWGAEDDNFYFRALKFNLNIYYRIGNFITEINEHGYNANKYFNENANKYNVIKEDDGINTNLKEINKLASFTILDEFKCNITEGNITNGNITNGNIIHFYVDFLYNRDNIKYNCYNYFKSMPISTPIIIGYINGGHYFINFISEYMKKLNRQIIIKHDNFEECNVIIGSYFGNDTIDKFKYNVFKIFISAENKLYYKIEKNYDLIIGLINNNNNIYNIPYKYFPYYAISIFEQVKYKNQIKIKDQQKCINERKFCSYMYSQGHSHRENFYRELSKYKQVDSLGKCCSNNTCNEYKYYDRDLYKENMTYQDSAIEKYSNYKFVISMENEYLDGYITEKFILPIKAGAIPIYWGTSDIKKHFNINSFIYINDFPTIQDCINYIKEVDNNNELYQSYIDNINICLENNEYLNLTKFN